MKVLVGCEISGAVRDAFRARGHEAWSLDIKGSEDPQHIRADLIQFVERGGCEGYDLCIFHPPCTDLAVSGARYFPQKRADGRQVRALAFVERLMRCGCDRWVVENPVSVISSAIREPDQVIQPWEFGHPESKATCLWWGGLLPMEGGIVPLRPTKILPMPECGYWENQTPSGQNRLGPSAERAAVRSVTYAGIAAAMADQWGNLMRRGDSSAAL